MLAIMPSISSGKSSNSTFPDWKDRANKLVALERTNDTNPDESLAHCSDHPFRPLPSSPDLIQDRQKRFVSLEQRMASY